MVDWRSSVEDAGSVARAAPAVSEGQECWEGAKAENSQRLTIASPPKEDPNRSTQVLSASLEVRQPTSERKAPRTHIDQERSSLPSMNE